MGLSDDADIATLGRRENISLVFIKTNESGLDKVVIPVRGFGLWGTMYGYLALESDLSTIAGLGFYQHKETPGLGGEVDNPKWKQGWQGVQLFNQNGQPSVDLVKAAVAGAVGMQRVTRLMRFLGRHSQPVA